MIMPMSEKLRWGILGAGQIGRTFAVGVGHSLTGEVTAVASRALDRAEQFGTELNIRKRYGDYGQMLADRDVDAVYIATPHPEHVEWAVKAAEAKKHVLCEKPIGVNAAEARTIIEAARRNDVFLMEAFMYRCHPQTAKIVELVKQKAIGDVRMVQATFGFSHPFEAGHRLWSNALAGGGILDVGCYPVSFARLIAGAAAGRDFLDPVAVHAAGYLHPQTRVDEYAAAVLSFQGGMIAQVATSVGVEQENVARVYGTTGSIFVPEPWTPSTKGQASKIVVQRHGESQPQEIIFPGGQWLYALEADVVARDLPHRQATSPAMSWDDTLGNMQTLDKWRSAIGLRYDSETASQR